MKKRHGFVSNSSSSSFIVIGGMYDESEFLSRAEIIERFLDMEALNRHSVRIFKKPWHKCDEDEQFDIFCEAESSDTITIVWSGDNSVPDGKFLVGFRYSVNDDDWELSEYPVAGFIGKLTAANINNISVFTGRRSC